MHYKSKLDARQVLFWFLRHYQTRIYYFYNQVWARGKWSTGVMGLPARHREASGEAGGEDISFIGDS